jgi:hypothetical protein
MKSIVEMHLPRKNSLMENSPIELENQPWKCISKEKFIDGKFTH